MNRSNAAQYLPLVQALADGELQIIRDGVWQSYEDSDVTFFYPPERYRRRPKPREWVHVYNKYGNILGVFPGNNVEAIQGSHPTGCVAVLVREVLDTSK